MCEISPGDWTQQNAEHINRHCERLPDCWTTLLPLKRCWWNAGSAEGCLSVYTTKATRMYNESTRHTYSMLWENVGPRTFPKKLCRAGEERIAWADINKRVAVRLEDVASRNKTNACLKVIKREVAEYGTGCCRTSWDSCFGSFRGALAAHAKYVAGASNRLHQGPQKWIKPPSQYRGQHL